MPTVGIAAALALSVGGTAAAASRGPASPELSASPTIDAASRDAARTAAATRADRTRTAEVAVAAATRKKTTDQRAAWVEKTTVAQRALAQERSTEIVASHEVELTASTLASKKAAATKAKTTRVAGVTGVDASGRYVLPVSSGVDRDTFGMTGPHWANKHTGQDFPVPLGTDVRAVSSGEVLETGWAGAFGNRMKLLLDDGTEIWYCHLSSYVVTSGRVSAGEIVARSGSTGNSTGPHLHMEVHLAQNPVASDPLNWLRAKGLPI